MPQRANFVATQPLDHSPALSVADIGLPMGKGNDSGPSAVWESSHRLRGNWGRGMGGSPLAGQDFYPTLLGEGLLTYTSTVMWRGGAQVRRLALRREAAR